MMKRKKFKITLFFITLFGLHKTTFSEEATTQNIKYINKAASLTAAMNQQTQQLETVPVKTPVDGAAMSADQHTQEEHLATLITQETELENQQQALEQVPIATPPKGMHVSAEQEIKQPELSKVPVESATVEDIESPVFDPSEARDVDYSYFNDPYLFEQYERQPMYDLQKIGLTKEGTFSTEEKPVLDVTETRDVDFSFFNDPYAFDAFRDALPVKAKFGGYVQHSSWWDSRQAVEGGDGYFYIYPKNREFDVDCKDINARGQFNMSVIETRLRSEFFGPKVLGAESYAYIETDFYGSGAVIERLRMRHAFIQLTWHETSKVMLGQFWNPMFVVKTFPLTVSFNGGVPFEIFARDPQVRFTFNKNKKEFLIAALAQLQYTSNGPIGFSSTYMRNSRMPMLVIRGAYDTEELYAGAGLGFLRLKPRLESDKGFRVNEYINSAQAFAFATFKRDSLEIRQQFSWAQNANNLSLLSGFAVTSINPTTDERHYTNTSVLTYWMDININKQIEPGIFIGVSKNLGAQRDIIQCIKDPATNEEEKTLYSFGEDIDLLFRAAPRARFHILPVDFAVEVEYTRALFGCIDNRAKVQNTDPVGNTRLIFTTYYYF